MVIQFLLPVVLAPAQFGLSQPLRSGAAPIKPGALLGLAKEIQRLQRAGRTPVVGTDPFTGNFLLSTRDQPDPLGLALTLADRAFFALTPAESEERFNLRQDFIDSFPGAAPAIPAPAAAVLPLAQGGPELAVQATFERQNTPPVSLMQSISCTSRATTLDALRRCQGGT